MGKAVSPREPADAIALGVGYCSEDRKADGIVPDMSVRENITLAHPAAARRAWASSTRRASARSSTGS